MVKAVDHENINGFVLIHVIQRKKMFTTDGGGGGDQSLEISQVSYHGLMITTSLETFFTNATYFCMHDTFAYQSGVCHICKFYWRITTKPAIDGGVSCETSIIIQKKVDILFN